MNDFEDRTAGVSGDLRIDWLRAFVGAVDTGSLAAAGRVLHRSPAAMSMKLKKLEQTIGRSLLERDARRLSLTECGQAMLPHARAVLAAHRKACEAALAPELRGTVHLGMPDDYASAYLAPMFREFASRHPGVDVTLTCMQSTVLIPQVSRGQIDLALVTRDRPNRGHLLFREPMVWVGSATCAQLQPLPLAVFEQGATARRIAERALRSADRPFRIAYESSSNTGQLAAVQSGLAIAALTRCSKPADVPTVDARHGLPALPRLEVALIVSRAGRRSPAVLAFRELVVRQLENHV